MSERDDFEKWFYGSKYAQVVTPSTANEQAAWDGWQAAVQRSAPTNASALAQRSALADSHAFELTDDLMEAGYRSFDWSSVPHPFRGSVGFERGARWALALYTKETKR